MSKSRVLLSLLALFVVPLHAVLAQTGRIVGTVLDSSRTPISGAQISVPAAGLGALSDDAGKFVIRNVPVGTHEVRAVRIGQKARTIGGVVVNANQDATLEILLSRAAITINGVVVSASRRVEKITDAPATVTSIDTRQLDNAVGNTIAGALKEVKGLDFIQVGMTSVGINARGFNSSFNSRFLMMEDGRISIIPESGLPAGILSPTPKIDLAGMEVLVGPGSALYGPDASNGVLYTRTKDPKQFQGGTIEVTGGSRSYKDVQGRYAGVTRNGMFGYKVAGEYQDANDWDNYLSYNSGGTVVAPGTAGSVSENGLRIPIDWTASALRGTGSVVYYRGDNRLELGGGWSKTNGVGQTNVGRNQLKDWTYRYLQARYTMPHWYFNAYQIESKSGKSFALNRFAGAQLAPANASLTADSLRMLSDWPSDGRLYAAEAQGNYVLPMLLNTSVIFGGQFRDDVVSSQRQWLTDRVTAKDLSNKQKGVYAQTTTPVSQYLDVVLAGRMDYPDAYKEQWSPKAGVVVKPAQDQAFRVTFNRAFKSPTVLQTDFFIPDWTSIISIYGNTGGFTVKNGAGATVASYDPLQPEENRTWEYGYKGVLAQRLYFDGTYYRSNYRNFTSPLVVISNPFAGAAATYAYPTTNKYGIPTGGGDGRIVNQAGAAPIVLIYYNLGKATLSGFDIGTNFVATEKLELRATLSTAKLSNLEVPAGREEATALNSTPTKWTLGATARDLGPLTVGTTLRNVVGYYFRSGSNTGVIPTFGTLDANFSLRLPQAPSTLINLGIANLAGCVRNDVTYTTPTGAQPNSQILNQTHSCGFGKKHREMINMPEIGTMVFLGVRLER